MATRIKRFTVNLNANQTNDGLNGDPNPFTLSAPSGITRTIVELRPWGSEPFVVTTQLNSEVQHEIDSNDVNTYHTPEYVGLEISGNDVFAIQFTNLGSSAGSFGISVIFEETVGSVEAAFQLSL